MDHIDEEYLRNVLLTPRFCRRLHQYFHEYQRRHQPRTWGNFFKRVLKGFLFYILAVVLSSIIYFSMIKLLRPHSFPPLDSDYFQLEDLGEPVQGGMIIPEEGDLPDPELR